MSPRRSAVIGFSLVILGVVGWYALSHSNRAAPATPTETTPAPTTPTTPTPTPTTPPPTTTTAAASGTGALPAGAAPSAVPSTSSFPAELRARAIADLEQQIVTHVGAGFPAERRAQLIAVQRRYWDARDADQDELRRGAITSAELDKRMRLRSIELSRGFADALSDDEYQRMFDRPKVPKMQRRPAR